MTLEEFNKTRFGSGMKVLYDGVTYKLVEVNFTEGLVGFNSDTEDQLMWARCENIELI